MASRPRDWRGRQNGSVTPRPPSGCRKKNWRCWHAAAANHNDAPEENNGDDPKTLWKWRGGGKRGKPNNGFPTFPTAPWKSPTARFPHSHSADGEFPYTATTGRTARAFGASRKTNHRKDTASAPRSNSATPKSQAHPVLESECRFRLIQRWNQKENKSRFQAHSWIGKC